MASGLIDLVLDDLGWLEKNKSFVYPALKEDLRFLRTFLMYAQRWSSDIHLESNDNDEKFTRGSFLFSIEDTLQRNAPDIRTLAVQLTDDLSSHSILEKEISNFREKIKLLCPKIKQVYTNLSDCSGEFVSPLKHDEFLRFIECLLDNLVDLIIYVKYGCLSYPEELFADFSEQLTFLKNFIRFATWQGVEQEQLKDLLVHIEVVASRAASLTFMCWIEKDQEEEISNELESLTKKIKLIEPRVGQTCIEALKACKSSGRLEPDDNIVADFVDSLLDRLWELLNCRSSLTASVKDQMKTLYQGLNFFRTVLKQEQEKLDKLDGSLNDLIGPAVNEAGIVIFFLSVNKMEEVSGKEIDHGLSDLLVNIEILREEIVRQYDFLDFRTAMTASNFTSEVRNPIINKLVTGSDDEVKTVINQLVGGSMELDIVCIVGEAGTGKTTLAKKVYADSSLARHFDVQAWCTVSHKYHKKSLLLDILRGVFDELPDKFYEMDENYLVEHLCNLLKKNRYLIVLDDVWTTDIWDYLGKLLPNDSNGSRIFLTSRSEEISWELMQNLLGIVVGLNDEAKTIIGYLTRGSNRLDIVSIVGMAGLGKTTLAKKVYNDPEIVHYFHVRGWCSVSQNYYKRNLLLDILGDILDDLPNHFDKVDEDDLVEQLYKLLKKKRYLIVLDDVWDSGVWNELGKVFPDDGNGSRILFTSRARDVALQANSDSKLHHLRLLTDDESWELLQHKLLLSKGCPPALSELGRQIAKQCQGLPLTIVVVAGILKGRMDQDHWTEVAESLNSNICGMDHCMNTLEMSYKYLPYYLKPCYLYFGVFPEDQEIPIWRLVCLWIAERLVKHNEEKSLESVAEGYIMDLASRSLVTVATKRFIGGFKTCRIHDLLHEFCVVKAKKMEFFQLLRTYDELRTFIPDNTCRLCIYSERIHFEKSRLVCPRVRSLLFFARGDEYVPVWYDISFIFWFFRLLRVLDFGEIDTGDCFPSEIKNLVHLRYLAVRGKMQSIPSSISKLFYLETFLIEGLRGNVSLPHTIWRLRKLRHLRINGDHIGFILCYDNLDNSLVSHNLDTFSTVLLPLGQNIEKVMRKFPSLRKLKCKLFKSKDSAEDYQIILDFLTQLESINMSQIDEVQYPIQFSFPLSLKILTLSKFMLPWSEISVIGKLPNLEVLKLLNQAFQGEEWEMAEGEFPNLKFLKLESLDIVRWTYSGDEFPPIQKLVLEKCLKLEEIPCCLGDSFTLETIKVRRCSYSAATSVKQIQEEQEGMGNENLKVIFDPPYWHY